MILGVGIELVDVPRFRASFERYPARWRDRVFTAGEQAYAAARRAGETQSLAVRFAAKCAARRALAAASQRDDLHLGWHEIEVVRESGRPPTLRFYGNAEKIASGAGVRDIALSLTHDQSACIAHVLVQGDER